MTVKGGGTEMKAGGGKIEKTKEKNIYKATCGEIKGFL